MSLRPQTFPCQLGPTEGTLYTHYMYAEPGPTHHNLAKGQHKATVPRPLLHQHSAETMPLSLLRILDAPIQHLRGEGKRKREGGGRREGGGEGVEIEHLAREWA